MLFSHVPAPSIPDKESIVDALPQTCRTTSPLMLASLCNLYSVCSAHRRTHFRYASCLIKPPFPRQLLNFASAIECIFSVTDSVAPGGIMHWRYCELLAGAAGKHVF